MNGMSPFEIIMLLCFGVAWPFSIWKSWKTGRSEGKSRRFLVIVLLGYVAGILHKIFYKLDGVIVLYVLNMVMVGIDLALYYRNVRRHKAH
jgi:formate hydrogenlyase subunit 3/multisubunit Na+/H+ antiporter MnhD subunit